MERESSKSAVDIPQSDKLSMQPKCNPLPPDPEAMLAPIPDPSDSSSNSDPDSPDSSPEPEPCACTLQRMDARSSISK